MAWNCSTLKRHYDFVVILRAILISNVGTAEKIRVINFNVKQSNGTESLQHQIDGANITATREATFCFKFMLRYSRGMLLIKTNQVHFTIMDQVWPRVKFILFASPKNLSGQVKSMQRLFSPDVRSLFYFLSLVCSTNSGNSLFYRGYSLFYR